MQLKKILQEAVFRYSFYFLILAVWVPVIILSILCCVLDYIHISQVATWILIIISVPILIPAYVSFVIITYCTISLVECNYKDFRVQSDIVYNPFSKTLFYLLLIFSIFIIILLICDTCFSVINNENINHLFFTFGIPAMITMLPINLIIYKIIIRVAASIK